MGRYLITSVLILGFTAQVMAAEKSYIILDNILEGCTIATAEPTDKTRYKVLGAYKSKTEAEKAIASMSEC